MSLQTISQARAKHALAAVRSWEGKERQIQKELKAHVTGMGPMMLMSGFGQTCAFYKSKGSNHDVVLQVLQDWLGKGDVIRFITESPAGSISLSRPKRWNTSVG